ncbi:DUF5050 domain-containing protein [Paenibacillus albidus]|uniref:DUF5050 domain-containing protein n=1 Tax=Paenibacillus albidus TaxID=2041023 RepID=UPI001BEB3AE2|nr:DUF5050 domain-containing protein [Paenibacillus albidus]MBT2293170.1 DUF5050 domain-containing protein [Paenibacillus albidus]
MSDNIAGGGLLLQTPGAFYITDLSGNMMATPGTYMLNPDDGSVTQLPGMLWFMNEAGGLLFASDQSRSNALCRVDTGSLELKVLLDEPCREVRLSGGRLYYIHEGDGKLYRCLPDGRKPERLTDHPVLCYTQLGETLYYATAQGIYSCPPDGEREQLLAEGEAAYLQSCGQRLLYADKAAGYALTLLHPETGHKEVYEELIPLGMNSDGPYVYCCNARNEGSIYRLDLQYGGSLRIYGERADRLQIGDGELFFTHHGEWYTMPLSGGQAVRVNFG